MTNDSLLVGLALFLGIGFITGLRSMTGPAVIAWAVYLGWLRPAGPLGFIGHIWAVALFTLLAIGELIADKLPSTPNRTGAVGLSGRILAAAFCGAVLAVSIPQAIWWGMVVTAITAVIGAFAGYRVRRYLTTERRLPDFPVAVAEDIFAIVVGLFTARRGV
jgi:uncharacterized membrane protein